jgi:hypothetical protein
MAIKFDFNKLRSAVKGWLVGTDVAGGTLTAGEQATYVPKIATARNIITTAASTDYTLYSKDSGSTILVTPNDVNVTLPSAEAGLHFTFILTGDYSTAACTIVQAAASEDFYGTLYGSSQAESATADADVAVSANTKVSFTTGGKAGDHVQLVSDGTGWYVAAWATVYTAITFDN